MGPINLFVYGTLKRDQRNHRYLKGQHFLGEARTLPRYRLFVCGGFPGLVDDPTSGVAVRGEVWAVDAATLARIDVLEGAPVLFSRRPVDLADFAATASAYFYEGDASARADCGDCWPPPR
jgi:gamma-glutamylcyclotransferase (GGCT)/AIG2-like uncharacterized protein YtfP